jgi:Flp pilus assembly secretin CpaC
MNCDHARQLLPLWIGSDLPDAVDAESLRIHVAACPNCHAWQRRLQTSLDALQSISTAATDVEPRSHVRPSIWPRVAAALSEGPRIRDRFNGWIPALAMALAASLMLSVSIMSVQRELGNQTPLTFRFGPTSPSDGRNLFETDARFAPGVVHDQLSNPLLLPASNSLRQVW